MKILDEMWLYKKIRDKYLNSHKLSSYDKNIMHNFI